MKTNAVWEWAFKALVVVVGGVMVGHELRIAATERTVIDRTEVLRTIQTQLEQLTEIKVAIARLESRSLK
jgi:sensor domain CHASE-containing protein